MPEVAEDFDVDTLLPFSNKYIREASPNTPSSHPIDVMTFGLNTRLAQLGINQGSEMYFRTQTAAGYRSWKKVVITDDLNNTGKAIKISSTDAGTDLYIEQNYTGNNWVRLQANEQGIKMLRYIDGSWKTVWSK